jgi:hypothetical protein
MSVAIESNVDSKRERYVDSNGEQNSETKQNKHQANIHGMSSNVKSKKESV